VFWGAFIKVDEGAGTVAIDPAFVPALCDRHRLSSAICAALPHRFSNALKTYFESSNGGDVSQAPYRGKAAHHLHIGDKVRTYVLLGPDFFFNSYRTMRRIAGTSHLCSLLMIIVLFFAFHRSLSILEPNGWLSKQREKTTTKTAF
jgi:hypothetical protein